MILEQEIGGYASQTHDGIRVRVGMPRISVSVDDGGVRASLRDPSKVRAAVSISALTGTDAWLEYADYRTVQAGLWSLRSNWEVYDGISWAPAKSYPGRNANTRDVTITHDMVMDVSPAFAMHDLTIDTFYQFDDGGHSFSIAGNWDSTPSTPSFEGGLIMTGTITFIGSDDQTLEVGQGNGSFGNITIAKSCGTMTIGTGISMYGTMTLSGGTLDTGGGIVLAHFVKTGGTLTGFGTLTFNDVIAHTFTTNEDVSVYAIVHSVPVTSGVRTLTFVGIGGTRTITITNSFERGGRSLGAVLSSSVLAYANGTTLHYSPSGAAMTSDADEWPVTNGPSNVFFAGSHDLNIPFSRTIQQFKCVGSGSRTITITGTLTTTNLERHGTTGGSIVGTVEYTIDSTLTYRGSDTIIGPEWPASSGPESCDITLDTSGKRCESPPASAAITRTLTKNFNGIIGILNMGGNDGNGILYVEGVVDQQAGFSLQDTEINPDHVVDGVGNDWVTESGDYVVWQ